MSHVERAGDPRSFLALVPAMMGFEPVDSLVITPLDPMGRTMGVMRTDLPPVGHESHCAEQMMTMLSRIEPAPAGFVVIQYTSDEADTTFERATAFMRAADESHLRMLDTLYVACDGYGSHDSGLPPAPLTDIAVPEHLRDRVQSIKATDVSMPDPMEGVVQILDTLTPEDLPFPMAFFESVVTEPLTAEVLALLAFFVRGKVFRDAMLVQWATAYPGGMASLLEQMEAEDDEDYIPEFSSSVLTGMYDQRPEAARMQAGIKACLTAVASTPEMFHADLLFMAAWLYWAIGSPSQAMTLTDQVYLIDPEHVMSEVLREFVRKGHNPEWVFNRKGIQP